MKEISSALQLLKSKDSIESKKGGEILMNMLVQFKTRLKFLRGIVIIFCNFENDIYMSDYLEPKDEFQIIKPTDGIMQESDCYSFSYQGE